MMERFLNIIPQHLIRTEIRRINTFKHSELPWKTFAISKIAIAIIFYNKMDFTAIMVLQKTNQPMLYWIEK